MSSSIEIGLKMAVSGVSFLKVTVIKVGVYCNDEFF